MNASRRAASNLFGVIGFFSLGYSVVIIMLYALNQILGPDPSFLQEAMTLIIRLAIIGVVSLVLALLLSDNSE